MIGGKLKVLDVSGSSPLAKEKETAPNVEALYENQTPCNLYSSKCEELTSSAKARDILPAKFHKQQRSWWGLQEGATVIAFKSTTLILSSCSSCTGVHVRIPRKAKASLRNVAQDFGLAKKLCVFLPRFSGTYSTTSFWKTDSTLHVLYPVAY